MILTYFERKVNLFKTYPQVTHNAEWRFTTISEYRSQRLPRILNDEHSFCQKKWLLHYGIYTILGSPELSRQVCSGEDCASCRLKSTFQPTAVDGEAILDDYGVPLWCLHGRNGVYCRNFLTFFRCSGTLYCNNFITL